MLFPISSKIWFYRQPIDFRKQINGLILLVAETLSHDPTSGQLFVFRNRKADKVKMLLWDHSGFWLLYKRLEKARFKFPEQLPQTLELNFEQLQWLLSGLDITKQPIKKPIIAKHFY